MKLSPRKARSNQLGQLHSDNRHTENYWILLHPNHVTIAKQTSGESCTQVVDIDKDQFNKLIDWYNREQKIKKDEL